MAKTIKLSKEEKARNLKQEETLNKMIKQIPLRKVPKMPFTSITRYLEEYNKIQDGSCKLSKVQQIVVKNVIHLEVQKGTIILKLIETETEKLKKD